MGMLNDALAEDFVEEFMKRENPAYFRNHGDINHDAWKQSLYSTVLRYHNIFEIMLNTNELRLYRELSDAVYESLVSNDAVKPGLRKAELEPTTSRSLRSYAEKFSKKFIEYLKTYAEPPKVKVGTAGLVESYQPASTLQKKDDVQKFLDEIVEEGNVIQFPAQDSKIS